MSHPQNNLMNHHFNLMIVEPQSSLIFNLNKSFNFLSMNLGRCYNDDQSGNSDFCNKTMIRFASRIFFGDSDHNAHCLGYEYQI